MVAAAIISAGGAYLFQLIGGRALGKEDFAPIAILWTLQFLGFTILFTPVEQLIIRRLVLAGGDRSALRSLLRPILGVIGGGIVIVSAYVALTLGDFDDDATYVLIAALLFLTLGSYAVARGVMAGQRQYRAYGIAVAAEAVARIGFAFVIVVTVDTALGLGWVLAVAPLAFLVARPWHRSEPATDPLPDETSTRSFLSGLLVMTTASQTILAAGTLVVAGLGATDAAVSVLHVTFTLFRGPLTASYNLLARILPGIMDRAADGNDGALTATVMKIAAGGGILAAAGAGVGAAIGPDIVALLFGSEFRPGTGLAAMAAAGVVLAGTALFIGQVLVARGTTNVLAAVWIAALIVAGITIAVTAAWDPTDRVATAFVVGEAAAVIGTVAGIARSGRRLRAAA